MYGGMFELATPNYKYEKRQKELAKKKRKDEKRQRRLTKEYPSSQDGSAQTAESGDKLQ